MSIYIYLYVISIFISKFIFILSTLSYYKSQGQVNPPRLGSKSGLGRMVGLGGWA